MLPLFVKQADGLLADTGGQRRGLQRLMPCLLVLWKHHFADRCQAFEVVEYHVAFDQHFAIVEHQRQRIVCADLVGFAKRRSQLVPKRQAL